MKTLLPTKLVTDRVNKACKDLDTMAGKVFDKDTLLAFSMRAVSTSVKAGTRLTEEQESALYHSVSHLLGKKHTEDTLRLNMYRLVANWGFILEGMPIPEWEGEPIDADAVFIGVKRLPAQEGTRPKYLVKIKLKNGLGAGIIKCGALYESGMYAFLDHKAGTSKFKCAAEELAGMEARVVVSASASGLRIHDWSCTQTQKKHNKQLAEYRSDISKCRLTQPCNTCKKTILECPLAVWLPADVKE